MKIIGNYKELYDNNKPLVVFDLETTGLNTEKDRIIEIGALRIENGIVVKKISTLLNPGIPVPYYATKVNGITTDMLQSQPNDIDGVKEFCDMLDDSYIIAHNISFDIGFINSYLSRMGRDTIKNNLVDTVRLARKAFPGRKKYSLGEIAKNLGIDVFDAHRAEDDTRVCYELYKKSINELIRMENE